jgi:hypothetical protein
VDVSRSGLSVQVDAELGQGDEVELSVEPGIHIRAIAWRSRRTRTGFVVGMMLSEISPEYETLIARCEARGRPTAARPRKLPPLPPRPTAPPPPAAPEPAETPLHEPWWRLRVKETDGPRTRSVTLAAPSRALALEKAAAELGAGWEILEAQLTTADRKAS